MIEKWNVCLINLPQCEGLRFRDLWRRRQEFRRPRQGQGEEAYRKNIFGAIDLFSRLRQTPRSRPLLVFFSVRVNYPIAKHPSSFFSHPTKWSGAFEPDCLSSNFPRLRVGFPFLADGAKATGNGLGLGQGRFRYRRDTPPPSPRDSSSKIRSMAFFSCLHPVRVSRLYMNCILGRDGGHCLPAGSAFLDNTTMSLFLSDRQLERDRGREEERERG